MEPLTRDNFREAVFARDNHLCVICNKPAIDAHHIMERRLFDDEGYYLDNGASLCREHHLQAEMTVLSCEEIRNAAHITNIILPEHLYFDCTYDKWGNEILPNKNRIIGELFDDESVQKILRAGNILNLFIDKVKYPRTYHFPWSKGINKDDRILKSISQFENELVVMTEKMDGENSTLGKTYYHARSLDSSSHPSRSWIKNLWAQKGYEIPEGWRVCGENMFQKHAIHYTNEKNNALKTYFYAYNIWNEKNMCLSWDETKEWAYLLDFELVPILYEGIWDINIINKITQDVENRKDIIEGYTVRLQRAFHYSEFNKVYGKYVRANHVQNNHGHWMQQKVIKNELIK
jgi:hypothetical protein